VPPLIRICSTHIHQIYHPIPRDSDPRHSKPNPVLIISCINDLFFWVYPSVTGCVLVGWWSLWQNTWQNLRKEGFILAHGFRGFSPVAKATHPTAYRRERERERDRERDRQTNACALGFPLSLLYSHVCPACGKVPPVVRAGLSLLVNPLWKYLSDPRRVCLTNPGASPSTQVNSHD
jgi:hypothetical protein